MHLKRVGRWLVLMSLVAAACSPAANPTPEFVELEGTIDVGNITIRDATQAAVAPAEMTLAEAEPRLPFAVSLPTAVPDGFAPDEFVEVVAPETAEAGDYASLIVTWANAGGATVRLHLSTVTPDAPAVGAVGQGEAVLVKGLPATLLQTQGLGPERLTLTWRSGAVDYRLTAEGDVLTGDDLLHMAESIP